VSYSDMHPRITQQHPKDCTATDNILSQRSTLASLDTPRCSAYHRPLLKQSQHNDSFGILGLKWDGTLVIWPEGWTLKCIGMDSFVAASYLGGDPASIRTINTAMTSYNSSYPTVGFASNLTARRHGQSWHPPSTGQERQPIKSPLSRALLTLERKSAHAAFACAPRR
jgi:hypothetical protein